MLEGLEVSEVLFSYIKQNDILRVDSQFYKKDFLNQENLIDKLNHKSLIELGNQILSFGAYSLNNYVTYKDKGIPFIRGVNLKNGRIDFSDVIYIDDKENDLLWKSEIKPLTILLSMSGTIGDVALASEKLAYPINSNQDIAKIHPNKNINPYFLYSFFRSKFGQNYLKRESRGSVQQHVFLSQIEKFEIPIFSDKLILLIEKIIKSSDDCFSKSKQTYTQAEQLLLSEIGLQNFTPSTEAVNIKSFADSFATSGRLDAEYYQKKYDDIESAFNNFERITLSDLVKYPISSGITPKAGGDAYTDERSGIPFVRAVDLKNGEVQTANFNYLKQDVHNGVLKRTQLQKNDVLFSIAGTVGRTAIFQHDFEANINQAVAILRFDETQIIRLYLVVFFNSLIGKEFIEKYARQGLQTNLNLSEVGSLSIPIVDYSKQQQIADLVEQSFALKQQNEHLLEVAKRAVEIAIEESEDVAMAYIESEVATNE